jgi:diguanylate cyclase (GGDEF)-like protein
MLKAKNYNQLVSELVKQQAREEGFSRLGFYSNAESEIDQPVAVSWQVKDSTDKIIKDYFKEILPQLAANEIYDINNIELKFPQTGEPSETLSGNDVKYLASVPWINNTRAILAWADDRVEKILAGTFFDFWRNAIPLAEHISRFEKAEEMSYTDALTGTYNLRYFRKRLIEEFNRANRYGRFLTLMIIDVDELKTINDNYGHQAGDRLLKKFAKVLLQSVRGNDVISRYGGDEFCLIMPETSRNRARLIMDRIQKMISQNPMDVGDIEKEKHYTVSIGGAVYPDDANTVEELIKAADMALLQAKSQGRNCGCMFSSDSKENP